MLLIFLKKTSLLLPIFKKLTSVKFVAYRLLLINKTACICNAVFEGIVSKYPISYCRCLKMLHVQSSLDLTDSSVSSQ